MRNTKLETIRTYRRDRFEVELAAHVEDTHPAETVAWDDPEAEREYVRKIETGEYPWFCLGVHVYVLHQSPGRVERRREIGSAFLGWCDTHDLSALGARDVVAEAIHEARDLMEAVR